MWSDNIFCINSISVNLLKFVKICFMAQDVVYHNQCHYVLVLLLLGTVLYKCKFGSIDDMIQMFYSFTDFLKSTSFINYKERGVEIFNCISYLLIFHVFLILFSCIMKLYNSILPFLHILRYIDVLLMHIFEIHKVLVIFCLKQSIIF